MIFDIINQPAIGIPPRRPHQGSPSDPSQGWYMLACCRSTMIMVTQHFSRLIGSSQWSGFVKQLDLQILWWFCSLTEPFLVRTRLLGWTVIYSPLPSKSTTNQRLWLEGEIISYHPLWLGRSSKEANQALGWTVMIGSCILCGCHVVLDHPGLVISQGPPAAICCYVSLVPSFIKPSSCPSYLIMV